MLAKGKGKYCSRQCIQHLSGELNPLYGTTRSTGFEKICEGCGATFTHRRSTVRFCSVACHHRANPPKPTPWHRSIAKNGYVRITLPTGERVLEHRWVWQQANGPIPPGALIHHINEIKTDNRLENLKLVESLSAHNAEHGGSLRDAYPPRSMARCHPDRPNRGRGFCQSCYMKDRRGTL